MVCYKIGDVKMRNSIVVLSGLLFTILPGCGPGLASRSFQLEGNVPGTSRCIIIEAEDAVDYTFTPGYYPIKPLQPDKAVLLCQAEAA